jgi:DNA-binding transcriptional ArsR family regulator
MPQTQSRSERAHGSSPEAAARLFRVLGDPTRLRILEALREDDRTVSQLVEIVGAPQSRVSNHLACLKWCRLVSAERRGRNVIYRLERRVVGALLDGGQSLAAEHEEYLASCTRIGPDWV